MTGGFAFVVVLMAPSPLSDCHRNIQTTTMAAPVRSRFPPPIRDHHHQPHHHKNQQNNAWHAAVIVPCTFLAGVLANINGTNVRPLLLNVNLPGGCAFLVCLSVFLLCVFVCFS